MSILSKAFFHDEAAAFAYLEELIWQGKPVCPHCGNTEKPIYELKGVRSKPSKKNPEGVERHGLKKCGACRKQFTVRVGTVFESSHVPLFKWLQAAYLMMSSKKGVSSKQLERTLEVTYKTAWFMSHRLREAMMAGNLPPMGGEGAFKSLKHLSDLVMDGGENPNSIKLWIKKSPLHLNRDISRLIQEDWRTDYTDYGTLEGVLQAIQDGRSLTIKVKDLLFPNPITCYLKEGLLEDALSNFRKRVELMGEIHYRRNGTPISMHVHSVEVLPDDDDLPSASDVRGIFKAAV